MAPSLEQRKDLLKTSGWQIADVVVWDGMRLIVSRSGANFFRPDRQYIQCAEHNILRRSDGRRNEQSSRLTALLGFWLAAATSLLLTSRPHGRAACVVVIGT